jgi:hypothetical protein
VIELNLSQVTDIVCHDNCSDGTVSAMLLHDALPSARIRFCQYGISHEKLEVKPNMLFCDFSPHESRYQEFAAAGAIILDHHKSARHIVDSFGERGVFGDEATEPGVSGAVLAFRHVWLPLTNLRRKHDDEVRHAADIARLIGIRDTWQKHDPDWLSACELGESVRFFSQDSWLIEDPFAPERHPWWAARRSVGQRLVEKQHVTLRKVLEGAYRFTSPAGTRVVLFSGTKLTSDACEVVKEMADLIVGFDYFAVEDGQASLGYSLRSYASSKFDCSTFCKTLGGGGHSKAAGFSVRFDPALGTGDPYSVFQDKLREYEAAAWV